MKYIYLKKCKKILRNVFHLKKILSVYKKILRNVFYLKKNFNCL